MLNEENYKEILQQSHDTIKSRDRAFIKMVIVFLTTLILFNGSALAIIVYCYFQTHIGTSCDEFTKNISWVITGADSALSWFICSATAFYAIDKSELLKRLSNKILSFIDNEKQQ